MRKRAVRIVSLAPNVENSDELVSWLMSWMSSVMLACTAPH